MRDAVDRAAPRVSAADACQGAALKQKMLRQLILLLLLRTTPAAEPCLDVAFEINDLSFDGDEFVVALSLARARFVGNATAAAAALLRDGLRRSIAGRVADAVVEELAPAALATAREVAAAQVAAEAPVAALLTPGRAVGAPYAWADASAEALADHVAFAVRAARRGLSALATPRYRGALDIVGMSDAYGRHFLNNLLRAAGSRYLEVGTFKGSTLVAALAANEFLVDRALAIDSYAFDSDAVFVGRIAQSGDSVRAEALANVDTFLDPRAADRRELRVANCFAVDAESIGRFNVYLYDGEHEYNDQLRAFTHFDAALEDLFVALVDDWNYPPVRHGTRDAFERLGYDVVYGEVLGGGYANGASIDEASVLRSPNPWWNGLYVAVVRKCGGTRTCPS